MQIYRLHVSLQDIKPMIWRRIEVSSETTLKQFHRILQIAMGWENCHLHEYIVDGRRYATPDPNYDRPGDVVRETGVRLSAVLPAPGSEILYIYDFGDYWRHDVRLEAVLPPGPGLHYPRVIAGERSCPPEDCGGTGGYTDLLEVLLDPTHEDFEHFSEWVGRRFNAEVYSVDAVNERLLGNKSLVAK